MAKQAVFIGLPEAVYENIGVNNIVSFTGSHCHSRQ
jgi:hypothetical protein